ncbi:hypothetical protein B0J14DRAFT_484955, partial [Halenospora varia]
RTLGTELVTVHVGAKRKTFAVHKNLLCDTSTFFRNAFDGPFKEGADGVMYMPEDDPTIFELFVNWLYRDTLPEMPKEEFKEQILSLSVLADKICSTRLSNSIVDYVQDSFRKEDLFFTDDSLVEIYSQTPDSSKLRQFAILTRIALSYSVEQSLPAEIYVGCTEQAASMVKSAKNHPEIPMDYMALQIGYGHLLRGNAERGAKDPRIRGGEKGFERCFFHD